MGGFKNKPLVPAMVPSNESLVGIVTTVRLTPKGESLDSTSLQRSEARRWSVLEAFLLYHLDKGFDRIYLFFDAADGSDEAYVRRVEEEPSFLGRVEITRAGAEHDEAVRESCSLWPSLALFYETEVQARQSLNAELAIQRAEAEGLRWLLHIDADELFWTPEPSVKPHFAALEAQGVEQMTYANHEGVPERDGVDNYFAEVTLFRRHHLCLPISHEASAAMRWWCARTGHGQYMIAYDCGKSAARVAPGVVPDGVHTWRCGNGGGGGGDSAKVVTVVPAAADVEEGKMEDDKVSGGEAKGTGRNGTMPGSSSGGSCNNKGGSCSNGGGSNSSTRGFGIAENGLKSQNMAPSSGRRRCRTALADPRNLRPAEIVCLEHPCVLHYLSCGLMWLRDKYAVLGAFKDAWFGGRLPIAPCFHRDARDALAAAATPAVVTTAAAVGTAATTSVEVVGRAAAAPAGENGAAGSSGGGGSGDCGAVDNDGWSRDAIADPIATLFRSQVLLCPRRDEKELERQLRSGVCERNRGPAEAIAAGRRARGIAAVTATVTTTGHSEGCDAAPADAVGATFGTAAASATAQRVAAGGAARPVSRSRGAVVVNGGSGGVKASASGDAAPAGDASEAGPCGYEKAWMLGNIARIYL
ncbi:unnamed protein product [Phaeothamnion confervicola]